MIINTRPRSPSRAEAISKSLLPKPFYSPGVRIGNWVEDSVECPPQGTYYFPPKDTMDPEKMKPEMRSLDFRQNKLSSQQGEVSILLKHDSFAYKGNYATTSDLVYNHLPKPFCGPPLRYYRKSQRIHYPQPDLTQCYGNATEWGLRKYWTNEWKCSDVYDYSNSCYEDSYVRPLPDQYLPRKERKARDSSFTKGFRYKMTKPKS